MKALACGLCTDIRALAPTDGVWTSCRCGNVAAAWEDGSAGTARFRARDRAAAFVIGFNNHFLVPSLGGKVTTHELRRKLHDAATSAPNHVFDKERAGCWAVVFRVGETNDVRWDDGA